ncbi:MAG: 30S ribosomal protein S13, partial [Candidatus Woesearchaeota archaeon]|nr:30S ribosomal protein S13 [Candidatus Woesearchaeota archaeon]
MEKKPERKMEGKVETSENFRHIVRVANTDLEGKKKIGIALKKIRGISFMMINAICTSAAIEPAKTAGELSDAELRKIEEIIKNPAAFGIPSWMFNRRGDYETGSDLHLIGNDLRFMQDNDVKRMRMIK